MVACDWLMRVIFKFTLRLRGKPDRYVETPAAITQRQRMGELGTKIAEFKRSLPHSCEIQPSSRCLKCDINIFLGEFEKLRLRHFPK